MSVNINDYVSNHVIEYLKDRDEKIIEYERLLNIYKKHIIIDDCCVCKKFIGVRKYDKPIYGDKLVCEGAQGYRRCYNAMAYNALTYDGCKTIVCGECEDDYKYPWHEGNSWFGIAPRHISDDDFICIECGKTDN